MALIRYSASRLVGPTAVAAEASDLPAEPAIVITATILFANGAAAILISTMRPPFCLRSEVWRTPIRQQRDRGTPRTIKEFPASFICEAAHFGGYFSWCFGDLLSGVTLDTKERLLSHSLPLIHYLSGLVYSIIGEGLIQKWL